VWLNIVFDGPPGSGVSMLAAEQYRRQLRGVEVADSAIYTTIR
jgi:hypothetical protein